MPLEGSMHLVLKIQGTITTECHMLDTDHIMSHTTKTAEERFSTVLSFCV